MKRLAAWKHLACLAVEWGRTTVWVLPSLAEQLEALLPLTWSVPRHDCQAKWTYPEWKNGRRYREVSLEFVWLWIVAEIKSRELKSCWRPPRSRQLLICPAKTVSLLVVGIRPSYTVDVCLLSLVTTNLLHSRILPSSTLPTRGRGSVKRCWSWLEASHEELLFAVVASGGEYC